MHRCPAQAAVANLLARAAVLLRHRHLVARIFVCTLTLLAAHAQATDTCRYKGIWTARDATTAYVLAAEVCHRDHPGQSCPVNGGPRLRRWIEDPRASAADLEDMAAPEERSWIEARNGALLYRS